MLCRLDIFKVLSEVNSGASIAPKREQPPCKYPATNFPCLNVVAMGKAKTPRKAGAGASPYDRPAKQKSGGSVNNIFKFNKDVGQVREAA